MRARSSSARSRSGLGGERSQSNPWARGGTPPRKLMCVGQFFPMAGLAKADVMLQRVQRFLD